MFTCPKCENEIESVILSEHTTGIILDDEEPEGEDTRPCIKTQGFNGVDITCPDCTEDISASFNLHASDL